nr:DUF2971 domain-containing protein [Chromobacterium sp. ASV5]
MILYKYTDLHTAICHFSKRSTIKFSKPFSFNDPFEMAALRYKLQQEHEFLENKYAINSYYGVLSLTRNPTNPLMWSHYATGKRLETNDMEMPDDGSNAHGGIVFGIDSVEAGFEEEGSNLVPAKYGSIIYTATLPKDTYQLSDYEGFLHGIKSDFSPDILEAVQRIFLYKSQQWAYEEEVRVVRNLNQNIGSEIYNLNPNSVKELYIGHRHCTDNSIKILGKFFQRHFPKAEIKRTKMQHLDWGLSTEPIAITQDGSALNDDPVAFLRE